MPSLILTSVSSSSEPYCPGPVLFTCNATDISTVFRWRLNDTIIAEYTFQFMNRRYPLNLTVESSLINAIQVISVTSNLSRNSISIISTLRVSAVSVLNRSSIYCEDSLQQRSNVANISVVSPGINH